MDDSKSAGFVREFRVRCFLQRYDLSFTESTKGCAHLGIETDPTKSDYNHILGRLKSARLKRAPPASLWKEGRRRSARLTREEPRARSAWRVALETSYSATAAALRSRTPQKRRKKAGPGYKHPSSAL